jgi:hypothetical protein
VTLHPSDWIGDVRVDGSCLRGNGQSERKLWNITVIPFDGLKLFSLNVMG